MDSECLRVQVHMVTRIFCRLTRAPARSVNEHGKNERPEQIIRLELEVETGIVVVDTPHGVP